MDVDVDGINMDLNFNLNFAVVIVASLIQSDFLAVMSCESQKIRCIGDVLGGYMGCIRR